MNNLDDDGCAGGMRRKVLGAPHGRSLQGTGNAAARPATRPERSGYSFTAPYRVDLEQLGLEFEFDSR